MKKSLRKNLQNNPIIKSCASLRITLTCLILLFILTLWGTVDQVQSGLYLAQERFFNSFIFIFWGFIPFPGARLVLWVLFINLVCVASTRFVYRWSRAGITVIHFGLLLFFVAAFVTFHGVKESNITLREGEGTNVSTSYHDWEVSVWTQDSEGKNVSAFAAKKLRPGQKLNFPEYGVSLNIVQYYANSEAYTGTEGMEGVAVLSQAGIKTLKPVPMNKEPQNNFPGVIFRVEGAEQPDLHVLLYGAEDKPTSIQKGGKTLFMQLRRQRHPVAFVLRLKDFMMERHPNTEIARSYKSLVEILPAGGGSREVLISMNKPLRYKDFTLYQSSYAIDQWGRESSTLAVVQNSGRVLPYIASFVTVLGLVIHLLLMAFGAKLKLK
jgi:hypothetical protein